MSKVSSLAEAMSAVTDGTHLALTGFSITRAAVAAVAELVRAGRRGLTLTQVTGSLDTDLLIGSGCVERLTYSGGSLDRFGSLYSVNRAIATGMPTQEYSTLSLTLRLLAGSLGLPFVPTRSLIGSQLLDHLVAAGGAKMISDPFTGAPVLAVSAVRPDIAIVHANVCDEDGNASVSGPLWSIKETALASATVIVTAERVVPRHGIDPSMVIIPGTVVSAVAEVPGGGWPTAVYGAYDYDAEVLTGYAAASKAGGDTFTRFAADRLLAGMVTR
jgi:acyl CoA:acetate/3-ketoacid CoA transferase alpha subunit